MATKAKTKAASETKPQPIPAGYHSITPYLILKGAAQGIEFYKKAFGATECMRMPGPDGRIGHAELKFGDSVVMMADESPEMNAKSPQSLGGTPVSILLYVTDVDATVKKAVAAGAQLTRPVENKFYGDRMGTLTDPYGHIWHVATHVEDVPMEEMRKRAAAMCPQAA
ncbi:MAG TPA: VOC family protein [Verrucomicrobiae bacterium]|nr:VOC family protein [Verrucomicrobiae bacterium]